MKTEKPVSKFLLIFKVCFFAILLTAASNAFAGYYFVYTSVSIPDESCFDNDCYVTQVVYNHHPHHYHHHVIHKHKVIHRRHSSYHIDVYYPIPSCAEARGYDTCHRHTNDYVVYQADPDDAFSSGETYEQVDEPSGPSMDTCTADDTN